jgi:hypothetical protein
MKNYLIKESWNFLGYEEGDDGWPVTKLFEKPDSRFRIISDTSKWEASIKNVSRMGWPITNYKTVKISQEEADNLISRSKWNNFYKCYILNN